MAGVNKAILMGYLGQDPKFVETSNGKTICNLSLATSRRYKDSQGNVQEETEWHRVSLFGRLAEVAEQYCAKGSLVYIEGRIHTRNYTDKEGVERWQTEILADYLQLLGNKDSQSKNNSNVRQSSNFRKASSTPKGYDEEF